MATDWVTGERIWYAHLLDRKPKKVELEDIPAGPHTDIFVRGLVPDQVAMKLVAKLREYVTGLDRTGR